MPTGPVNLVSPSPLPAPSTSGELSIRVPSKRAHPALIALLVQQTLGSLWRKLCSGPDARQETRAGPSPALGLVCRTGMTKWSILGASAQPGPGLCGDRTCWRSQE